MILSLDRDGFRDAADGDRPVVVRTSATLDADVSPLTAYAALSGRTTDAAPVDYAFLLESAGKTPSSDPDGAFRPDAETDRHARYSFVGADPAAVVTVRGEETTVETLDPRYEGVLDPGDGDVLDRLGAALPSVRLANFPAEGRQRFDGGLVGVLGYDTVYDVHLAEVGLDRPDSEVPDAQFVLADAVLAFDHSEGTVELVCTPLVTGEDDAGAVYDEIQAGAERVGELLTDPPMPEPGGFDREREEAGEREAYERAVERAKEHVLDGDVYQAVLSRSRELYGEVDPLGLYAALRAVNPSPYMYLLAHDDRHVVGASPETLVSVQGNRVVANPIAGTCPRGESPVEDRRLAGELLADEKERAEHTMLVDLARNDVRRVSEPGSVRVEEFMSVLKYSHVQHIESTVTGALADGADAFDATRASFPAGTLAGAPKVRSMEIIDDLETSPRGFYGGGVGYYAWSGDADLAIVIRTATVEDLGDCDRVTVRAGAGIVADSDPTAEYEETEAKMDGVLAAIERIETGRAATEGDEEPVADPTNPESAGVGR